MRAVILGCAAIVLAALLGVVPASGASPRASGPANGIYLVQLADSPVVAYEGGISGYKATAPQAGQKVDPLSPDVAKYVGYLKNAHDAQLAKVGGTKVYDYTFSYNGFAAKLDAAQASKLAKQDGVVSVTPDEIQTVDTSLTPTFLGLTDSGGLWDQLGGPEGSKNGPGAGEGIIIGDIDSGIWPEAPSFSDRDANGKLVYQQIPGWHGKCTPGEAFNASMCNQKLIGAQWFNAGWGGDAGIDATKPWEFNSVRDYNGHGSHTASTAGGDYGVTPGNAAAFGKVSGIAPRARIAMYKALWSTADASTANGTTSDLVAAIDQAVSDGVDVINYSVSGTQTNFADPVEISFLFAARAGIFVAASAGNSGPTASTVAHPSPWITTVAAGTHNRSMIGKLHLGAVTLTGVSTAASGVTAPIINAVDAAAAGASITAAMRCYTASDNGGTPALDPAKVAGKIVVCDRGTNARVAKSLAVKDAGGVGMVLVNPSSNSLNADFHSVPTVHLQNTDYAAVHDYAANPGAVATIDAAITDLSAPAPFTADFSSRGPLTAGGGDLLKPDVIAPGQDILAAVAPPGSGGLTYNLYSGTSMSAPHVAGLGALLKQRHPDWSVMAIKSALMTTAYDVLDSSSAAVKTFSQGAGHVKPNAAVDPGLVYNSGWNQWLGFLCGTSSAVGAATCNALQGAGIPTSAAGFNSPSIAIGKLAYTRTVTRRVTNVGSSTATYTATASVPGITVAVSPSSLTLAPGASASFSVTFTEDTATTGSYTAGSLTWSDGPHKVRIPLVVKPVPVAAPGEVSGSYNVTFGYTGPFSASARGLVPATVNADTISDDPTDTFKTNGQGVKAFTVTIPAGTTYARFSTFDADFPAGTDIDLYLYKSNAEVARSGGGTAQEEIDLVDPVAGTYVLYVHGYDVAGTLPLKQYTWLLGSGSAGNMAVTAPSSAVAGQTGAIGLAFSGLTAGTKYLGSVAYSGAPGMPNPTIVRVDG